MRLCTSSEMKEIERLAQEKFKISDETLMETAGALAAREIQQTFLPELNQGRLAVICGPGNNGGDGLVTARHLYDLGFSAIDVFLHAPEERRSGLFKTQLERLQKQEIKIIDLEKESSRDFSQYILKIDALFGIGLSRPLEPQALEIIKALNACKGVIISLDGPSGLNLDTGETFGACVQATMTLTFGLAKPGLFTGEGPEVSGKIRVLSIGLPRELLRQKATSHFAFDEKLARRWLPQRQARSHKAQHGHLLVAAGTPGMWGAASLCCEAAYRVGVGYVTLAVGDESEALKSFVKDVGPEVLVEFREGKSILNKKSAVLAGPGAGPDSSLKKFIEKLLTEKVERVVLDADALGVLAEMNVGKLPSQWILTPHGGELSKLLGVSSQEIEKDRFHHAGLAAEKFGCLVLLKGFRTIVADSEGHRAVVTSGNAALAKAGTGDVLSGFIGGLLAQGVQPLHAAGIAAFFHGWLADEWLRHGKDIKSLLPRDLLALAPDMLGQLTRG